MLSPVTCVPPIWRCRLQERAPGPGQDPGRRYVLMRRFHHLVCLVTCGLVALARFVTAALPLKEGVNSMKLGSTLAQACFQGIQHLLKPQLQFFPPSPDIDNCNCSACVAVGRPFYGVSLVYPSACTWNQPCLRLVIFYASAAAVTQKISKHRRSRLTPRVPIPPCHLQRSR